MTNDKIAKALGEMDDEEAADLTVGIGVKAVDYTLEFLGVKK